MPVNLTVADALRQDRRVARIGSEEAGVLGPAVSAEESIIDRRVSSHEGSGSAVGSSSVVGHLATDAIVRAGSVPRMLTAASARRNRNAGAATEDDFAEVLAENNELVQRVRDLEFQNEQLMSRIVTSGTGAPSEEEEDIQSRAPMVSRRPTVRFELDSQCSVTRVDSMALASVKTRSTKYAERVARTWSCSDEIMARTRTMDHAELNNELEEKTNTISMLTADLSTAKADLKQAQQDLQASQVSLGREKAHAESLQLELEEAHRLIATLQNQIKQLEEEHVKQLHNHRRTCNLRRGTNLAAELEGLMLQDSDSDESSDDAANMKERFEDLSEEYKKLQEVSDHYQSMVSELENQVSELRMNGDRFDGGYDTIKKVLSHGEHTKKPATETLSTQSSIDCTPRLEEMQAKLDFAEDERKALLEECAALRERLAEAEALKANADRPEATVSSEDLEVLRQELVAAKAQLALADRQRAEAASAESELKASIEQERSAAKAAVEEAHRDATELVSKIEKERDIQLEKLEIKFQEAKEELVVRVEELEREKESLEEANRAVNSTAEAGAADLHRQLAEAEQELEQVRKDKTAVIDEVLGLTRRCSELESELGAAREAAREQQAQASAQAEQSAEVAGKVESLQRQRDEIEHELQEVRRLASTRRIELEEDIRPKLLAAEGDRQVLSEKCENLEGLLRKAEASTEGLRQEQITQRSASSSLEVQLQEALQKLALFESELSFERMMSGLAQSKAKEADVLRKNQLQLQQELAELRAKRSSSICGMENSLRLRLEAELEGVRDMRDEKSLRLESLESRISCLNNELQYAEEAKQEALARLEDHVATEEEFERLRRAYLGEVQFRTALQKQVHEYRTLIISARDANQSWYKKVFGMMCVSGREVATATDILPDVPSIQIDGTTPSDSLDFDDKVEDAD